MQISQHYSLPSFHQVQPTFRRSNLARFTNYISFCKNPLECLALVLNEYILPALEQFLYLRIGFGNELDDQPLAQLGQKIGQAVKWNFIFEIAR